MKLDLQFEDIPEYRPKRAYTFFKRLLDIVFSFLAIIILSPLFLIMCIIIPINSHGSPFYLDERYGRGGKPFKLIKFRSMRADNRHLREQLSPEQYAELMSQGKINNDPRVTRFGSFIRKSSLDELPQLFNVFVGQMSFIGPRVPTTRNNEKEHFEPYFSYILQVRPGISGLWGVSGRSEIGYRERAKLETIYVRDRSFSLDIKIFFKTFAVVFRKKGAK